MIGTPPPLSRSVARSRLILIGGLSATASIFAISMLTWLIWHRVKLDILAIAGDDEVEANRPISMVLQRLDAADAAGKVRPLPKSRPGELIGEVSDYLDARRGQTSIVYLASPVMGSFGERNEVVLTPLDAFHHVVREDEMKGAKLEELLAKFKKARGKRLLILDIGRSRADCDLGAFGDDVIAELELLAKPPDETLKESSEAWKREWAGFAILCSNASGQWTWMSDVDGRSVFGECVAEALRGGGDVGKLLKEVPAKVSEWVYANRAAHQTPIVLGDPSLTFSLPNLETLLAEDDPRQSQDGKKVREDLSEHYGRHEAYERGGLPGLDPIAWRDYRQAWLFAERLYRAGRINEAGKMLAKAVEKEAAFRQPVAGHWPSMELSLRVALDAKGRDLKSLKKTLDAAPEAVGARAFKDYAESQVLRFAEVYRSAREAAHRPPDASRASLIDEASEVRRLAEEAASAAIGGHPWIDRLLDDAGKLRREALDVLLSEESAETVRPKLEEAEKTYRKALEVAEACNLSRRVAADLPFLGAWFVRSEKQSKDRDLLPNIANEARKLDDTLDGARASDDPPLHRLNGEAGELRRDLDRLQSTIFNTAAELASKSGMWRDVDDVLSVPVIPPDLRRKLVDRSLSPDLSVALRPPAPVQDSGTGGEGVLKGMARQSLGSGVTRQEVGRRGLDSYFNRRSPGTTPAGAAPEVQADRSFDQHLRGLAQLEACLLTIGGLDDKGVLEPLRHLGESHDNFARAARRARKLFLQKARSPTWEDPTSWTAYERARLAVPTSNDDDLGASDVDIAKARWSKTILRFADILREDGDAKLAGEFLEGLRKRLPAHLGKEEDEKVKLGVEALDKKIRLANTAVKSQELVGVSPVDLTLTVHTPPRYPAGKYALLLGVDDGLRVDTDGWLGTIEGDPKWSEVSRPIKVSRASLLKREAFRATATPVLYYRGQKVVDTPVNFELPAVDPDFVVEFSTRKLQGHRDEMKKYGIDVRRIVDQSKKRDDAYFMYKGSETALDVVLKYTPARAKGLPSPRRVVASAYLDDKLLTWTAKAKAANPPAPPQPANKEAASILEFADGEELTIEVGKIYANDLKADGSVFRFEIATADANRALLLKRDFKVKEIDPAKDYYNVTVKRVQADRGVEIRIKRSEGDPVAFAVSVDASVSGGVWEETTLQEGARPARRSAGQGPNGQSTSAAILLHGDSAVFRFAIDPAFDHQCMAWVNNEKGRDPWHLEVKPAEIKAKAAPRANPPGQPPVPDGPGPGDANP